MSAERGEITFAGAAALVPGDGVVQVTAGRGAAAAGCGALGVAGADQVGELAAGAVAGLAVGVVAGTAGDRGQRRAEDAGRAGAGGSGAGGSGAGRGVAAAQAGVGGGGTVGVQGGDAPAGAGVSGGGGGQVAGVVTVEHAVPVRLAGGLGAALPGLVRDGEGDQSGQARAGCRAGTGRGTGTARAAGAAGVVRSGAGRVRRAVAWGRLVRGGGRGDRGEVGAAVAFLEQIQVGADAEVLQGAVYAGGAQVQGALLDVLPGGEDFVGGELAGDHAGVAGLLAEPADLGLAFGGFPGLADGVGVQGED